MKLFAGQRAWILQRVTALVLLAFVVFGAALLLTEQDLTYVRWRALATSPAGAVLIVLLFVAVALHAWVGMRDIALDYIKPPAARLTLLCMVAIVLAAVILRVAVTLAVHLVGGAGGG